MNTTTLRDVARAADVSVSTASKALGRGVESGRISAACREKVRAACQELGYRPNHLARSLQAGRASAIGTMLRELPADNQLGFIWATITAGMASATLERGCQLVVLAVSGRESPIDSGLRALEERRIDALVVPAFLLTPRRYKQLVQADVPVVLAGYPHSSQLPLAVADNQGGAGRVVEHLGRLGHRRLVWAAPGDRRDWWETQRRQAFFKAARTLGLDAADSLLGISLRHLSLEDQVEAVRKDLLRRWRSGLQGFTALVGYNDAVALGAYAAAATLGIRIPEELSVVAFDDIYGRAAYPPMTVVNQGLREVGRSVVDLAIQSSQSREAWQALRGRRVIVPTELIVRKSTAPPCR